MKKAIQNFLAQFPNDAWCWSQATDEVRDLARAAKEIYNEVDLNLTQDEYETKGQGALNFRSFKTPADWNTQGKKYILDTFDKMSQQAKEIFYKQHDYWFLTFSK